MTDIDTAFVQQIFHVAQRKRKPDVQHHHKADDLWARLEVSEWGSFAHGRTLLPCPTCLEPVKSDNAFLNARGYGMYIIMAKRMTSGDVRK